MTYDASDPAQVAKAEKEEADRQRDLDYILKEPRGRRFLYGLIYDTCHVGRLSHIPGDSDSTAFNEGARSVGEALLEQIRTQAKAKYMVMMHENHFGD
jgi:hypothetical protein